MTFNGAGQDPSYGQRLNWARIGLLAACGVFHVAWIAVLAFYGL